MPILDWLNKKNAVQVSAKVPYRLLEPVAELSSGDTDNENLLIQGDNLEALKALIPLYAGKVKCIYIDPPYNTKSAFEHYDDNLEHSQWLSMMYPRLELLRELLSEDGSIWVSIDDNEGHYLKVMMDEVFGRASFIASICWQKVFAKKNKALISGSHDYLLVYGKNSLKWRRNLLPRSEEKLKAFKNIDNDPRGLWQSVSYTVQSEDSQKRTAYRYEITLPNGDNVFPPQGRHWNGLPSRTKDLKDDNRLWFGQNGDKPPRLKVFLSEVQDGLVPDTWWDHKTFGSNQESKKEQISLFPDGEPFLTPKPEKLLEKVIFIATNDHDIVLDSFAGSGTSISVAHKMNRRYIGIEMGEHAVTHCQPRLKKVVDGEQGGISKAANWQGGGGFRFYRLGETVFDEEGYINPEISFAALASHIWYMEIRSPLSELPKNPLLGVNSGIAYYLLYNGILGDKRPQGGNVLTNPILKLLPEYDGPKVIYGETTRLGAARLQAEGIVFKQIPYDVRAR